MPAALISRNGARKYLNGDERRQLAAYAQEIGGEAGLLCWLLMETGCRISEALDLQTRSIDLRHHMIVIESLKKRRGGVYRAVPVSEGLIAGLDAQFGIAATWLRGVSGEPIWTWSRATAYRKICAMMDAVGIRGGHASPKGLRHGFGVAAVSAGISLNIVQRWLGHADMKTTAIYANVSGTEERALASRIWHAPPISRARFRRPRNHLPHYSCLTCPHASVQFAAMPAPDKCPASG